MKLLDLSQPLLHAGPNCPGHPSPVVRYEAHTDGGSQSWQMEYLELASHTGSHVDAPRHKVAGGATLSDLPLETFAGPAFLLDLRGAAPGTVLDEGLLAEKWRAQHGRSPGVTPQKDSILLLATGWGHLRARNDLWWHQSPRVSPSGGRWIVGQGFRGVGIDHYSVGGSHGENAATHQILLGAAVWILEELRFPLECFELPWPQQLMALPLNIPEASGAPCRPVLLLDTR